VGGVERRNKMAKLSDALKAVKDDLQDRDTLTRIGWNAICADYVTMDRGQAKHLWEILVEKKIFIHLNGKNYRINHDQLMFEISKTVNQAATGIIKEVMEA